MSRINLNKLRLELNAHPYTGDLLSLTLRDRVVRCALQHDLTIYDDELGDGIITVKMLGIEAYGAWRTADLESWFYNEMEKLMKQQQDAAEESVWVKVGTSSFDHAAANLCTQHFICCDLSETTKALYRVEDRDKRQVVRVGDNGKDRVVEFARVVSATLAQDGVGVTDKRVAAIILSYMSRATVDPAPTLLGQPGDLDWCLHRADVEPDASVPFRLTRQFTDRLWDPEAFGAFLWGVYAGINKGRQILYISDPRGEGGKSKLIAALNRRLYGDRICASYPANALAAKNPHASSAFVGKRLVCVGDNRNPYLLHTVMFKELSGDDMSFVNVKSQQPFSTYFNCRAMVFSNYAPAIMGDQHNLSRTLWIPLEPLLFTDQERDPDYAEKCVAELPGFLAWCKTCYEQRCVNDYAIQINDRVAEATRLRIAECESQYSEPFDEHFTLDQDGHTSAKEWAAKMRELRMDTNAATDFRNWTLARHPQITELFDPKRPTRWSMDGVRPRRAGDHWRESGNGHSYTGHTQPRHDHTDEFVFDTSED